MNVQLRNMARTMSGWPLVGRLVRIAAAVIRLPEFRAAYLDLNHRQHMFETQQLPTLLQTLSDLNHRQLANERDKDNLVRSAPVALRKITRELADVRGQLGSLRNSMEQCIDETQGRLASVANSMEQRIDETQGRLESVVNSIEQRVDATQDQVGIATTSLERRINEAQKHLEGMSNSVGYLLGRVEFVRRELMFEMRYGASAPSAKGEQLKAKTEILSPEKLAAARNERLRLNLGCGHVPLEGYLNVDRRALSGVDIVAEIDELPFEEGEVDEIFSAHLLEHFPQEQLRRQLLPYFRKLLKAGGIFQAVVPDGMEMTRRATVEPGYFESLRLVTFGGQDYDGDFHYNMFSTESLTRLLEEAGFVNVEIIDRARQNDICYEFEIRSTR